MNSKEFRYWLKGYLEEKKTLDKWEVRTVKKILSDIYDEPKVISIPTEPFPKWQEPHKMNPTCETGKQLLNDNFTIT